MADNSILDAQSTLDSITYEIAVQVHALMLKPGEDIDIKEPLTALGVDSLVIMEVRNWIKNSFLSIEPSIPELLGAGNMEGLGTCVVGGLKKSLRKPTEAIEQELDEGLDRKEDILV